MITTNRGLISVQVDILIPVKLTPDWLKVAVGRYAKYALPSTVFQGRDMSDVHIQGMGSPQDLLRIAQQAETEGADACIIDCFTDPGLDRCSAQIKIPVIGVGQAGMWAVKLIGARFAIITTEESIVDLIAQNAVRYGVGDALHSVTAIGMPFDEVPQREEEAFERLEEISLALLPEVDVFLLGCTELAELARPLCLRLQDEKPDVQVINPLIAATHLAETLSLARC